MNDSKQPSASNLHDGHRDRLRARFREVGFDGFAPHEMMELLLTYALPRVNTNEIAHNLIDRFGTVSGILNASAEELQAIRGIGDGAVLYFNLLSAIRRQCELDCCDTSTPFNTIERLTTYLRALYTGINTERVTLMLFDNSLRMLDCITLGDGTVNSAPVTLRRIVEEAVGHRAACVALAHNHPRGMAIPSGNDIAVTESIEQVLRALSIPLLEHFIVAEHSCEPMLRSRRLSAATAPKADRELQCFCSTFYGEVLADSVPNEFLCLASESSASDG